jgi:hypothetical protein
MMENVDDQDLNILSRTARAGVFWSKYQQLSGMTYQKIHMVGRETFVTILSGLSHVSCTG